MTVFLYIALRWSRCSLQNKSIFAYFRRIEAKARRARRASRALPLERNSHLALGLLSPLFAENAPKKLRMFCRLALDVCGLPSNAYCPFYTQLPSCDQICYTSRVAIGQEKYFFIIISCLSTSQIILLRSFFSINGSID